MKIGRFFLPLLVLLTLACASAPVASEMFKGTEVAGTPVIPVTSGQLFSGCGGPVIDSVNPAFEQSVIEQTNEVRMSNGLPPLKHVPLLDESARYHTADMSVTDYFDHNTLNRVDGRLVKSCDTWERIQNYYTDWLALGENIAAGQRTPEMAMDGWMHSPDHKHNILSDSYSEIGVGYYQGRGEYKFYWGQNFGRRDGVFPLVLNGEKAQTKSRTVPVYVYGDFDQMRLRSDDGSWTEWMPFQNQFTYDLPDSAGAHTVTAELKGKGGKKTSSDTIIFSP